MPHSGHAKDNPRAAAFLVDIIAVYQQGERIKLHANCCRHLDSDK